MLSVIAAVEPLRVANRLLGRKEYDWVIASEQGGEIRASNGIEIASIHRPDEGTIPDYTFVCAGLNLHCRNPAWLSAFLNRRKKSGTKLGAISMGCIFLARAGLLKDKKCTIHWEGLPAFTEEFPDIEVSQSLYEIDGDILTSAGGFSSFDLFLELIRTDQSDDLARRISNQLQFGRRRWREAYQIESSERILETAPPKMIAAIKFIEENLERNLCADELASEIGTSRRTLERLFFSCTGQSPAKYIKVRRLERARDLLLHSNMSVLEVAIATGFKSGSYFSVSFSEYFGSPPSKINERIMFSVADSNVR